MPLIAAPIAKRFDMSRHGLYVACTVPVWVTTKATYAYAYMPLIATRIEAPVKHATAYHSIS